MRNLRTFVVLALILPALAHASDTMRCGSRLVSTEQLAAQVLGACGEPDYIDRWEPPVSVLPLAALADVEEWYYNFGPSQLLRVLHFQHGRLAQIDNDGYGFPSNVGRGCDAYRIIEGLSKYRLQFLCGPPVTRRVEYALRPLRRRHGGGTPSGVVQVYSEEWVYNFGAHNQLRVVTLENGKVSDVHGEGRGFDPR